MLSKTAKLTNVFHTFYGIHFADFGKMLIKFKLNNKTAAIWHFYHIHISEYGYLPH